MVRGFVHDFIEGGGNLTDTAPAYGDGVAGQMVGKLLATDIPRDSSAIATKAGFVIRGGRRVIGTSRAALLNDLEGLLRRLCTDHVDLRQVHTRGNAPIRETLPALDSAISRGLTRYAEVGNFIG